MNINIITIISQIKNYRDFLPADPYKHIAIFIFIITFLYVSIRASILSITHDEALTLAWHVPGSIIQIFSYSTPGLPDNNHLLHTLFVKLTTSLFGISEFVVRIPSLSGCALYLFGAYHSLCLITKKRGLIMGAVLLSSHPFLVDFFSIARGYSLGLGFTMLGLYYFLTWASNPIATDKSTPAKLSSLMFAMAVMSNLSFLVLYAGGILIIFLFDAYSFRKSLIVSKDLRYPFMIFFAKFAFFLSYSLPMLIITCSIPVLKIMKANLFLLGGTKGFWPDTVYSLVEKSLYGKQYIPRMEAIAYAMIIVILALGIGSLIYKFIRRKKEQNCWFTETLLSLLFICALVSIVQHHLFGTAFLTERRAIFFIPIFLLFFVSIANNSVFYLGKYRFLFPPLVNLLSIVFILYFLSCVNFTSYLNWEYDSSTKAVMTCLKDKFKDKNLPKNSKSLGINWVFEPSINYYISRYKMNWMKKVDQNGPDGEYDYYYVQWHNKHLIKKYNLEILKDYPASRTYLAAKGTDVPPDLTY